MLMKKFRTDKNSYSPAQTRDAGSDMETFGQPSEICLVKRCKFESV